MLFLVAFLLHVYTPYFTVSTKDQKNLMPPKRKSPKKSNVVPIPTSPVIGVRIPAWATFTREIFGGIVRYMRLNRQTWQLRYMTETTNEIAPVKIDADWTGDGIIVFRPSEAEVTAWQKRGIPVVNLSCESGGFGAPTIVPQDTAAGQIAARHLSDLGLKHFAFWGDLSRKYSRERGAAFIAELKSLGRGCHEIGFEISKLPQRQKWVKVRDEMLAQLADLPKPIGIFARDDIAAAALSRACARLGLKIPNEVALLGFGDDQILCHTATPPLSSISYPGEKIGYTAAGLLAGMMSGGESTPMMTQIAPGPLMTRESTEILAFGDQLIENAVRIIRQEAPGQPLHVSELIARLPVSRVSFQKRFRAELGRSPKDEITRVRLQRLCQLLDETDWSIKEIAFKMQFEASEELGRFIRRKLGVSATEYRQRNRS
jgi:LacI family transcriptional regulator